MSQSEQKWRLKRTSTSLTMWTGSKAWHQVGMECQMKKKRKTVNENEEDILHRHATTCPLQMSYSLARCANKRARWRRLRKERTAPEMQTTTKPPSVRARGLETAAKGQEIMWVPNLRREEKKRKQSTRYEDGLFCRCRRKTRSMQARYNGRIIIVCLAILGGGNIARSRPNQANGRGCGLRLSMFSFLSGSFLGHIVDRKRQLSLSRRRSHADGSGTKDRK